MTTLVVFEDEGFGAFEILATLRAVFDLRMGARTLVERLQDETRADQTVLLARPLLHDILRETHPDAEIGRLPAPTTQARPDESVLFVNGRFLALGRDLERLDEGPPSGFALFQDATLVVARCTWEQAPALVTLLQRTQSEPGVRSGSLLQRTRKTLPDLRIEHFENRSDRIRDGSRLLDHAWEIVLYNGLAIVDDFRKGPPAGIEDGALLYPGVHLIQESAIRIAPGARLKPGVVLDADDGPITIARDADLQPNCVVRGPVYVGPGCLVRAGAKLHEGTSLGPVCKVGGEIEETVLQGFGNKQHDGFLGHAFLGEWVNLGADTNNSDLKNNYSTVRVWESNRFVDTGTRSVGLLAADHVKSAINTQFNTGTVVGLSSQVFGSGFPPKFVPPFSWGGSEGFARYDYERALETARVVMKRRDRRLSPAYEKVFRKAYEIWEDRDRGASPG